MFRHDMLAPLQLDCRSRILVGGYLGEVVELAEFLVLFSSCAVAFLIRVPEVMFQNQVRVLMQSMT